MWMQAGMRASQSIDRCHTCISALAAQIHSMHQVLPATLAGQSSSTKNIKHAATREDTSS
eukprot:1160746-Pelagomonas_calceolata.AAC.5